MQSNDIKSCEVCGTDRNLDRHHVIPRRMGGTKNPEIHDEKNLITLCRQCHQNCHEGVWELRRSKEGVFITDKRTGELIMRRLYEPSLDIQALFQRLNAAEESVLFLLAALPFLPDEALVEAFSYASSFGKRGWILQSAILHEAQKRWRELVTQTRLEIEQDTETDA